MEALLKQIFEDHYHDVYAYLYSLSRDALLSEDLASEVFMEVVTSIAGFRWESDIKTWLFSIARHRWFRHMRRLYRQPPTEILTDFDLPPTASLEEQMEQRQILERIHRLLEAEPERTRSIVRLRLQGYSFWEIGKRHGISEQSARVIDFRAKGKLKQQLIKEGLLDEPIKL